MVLRANKLPALVGNKDLAGSRDSAVQAVMVFRRGGVLEIGLLGSLERRLALESDR